MILFAFNLKQVDTEEDSMPIQISISELVIAVAVSVMVIFIIGIILGLLCGKQLKKTNSKKSIHPPEDNMKCPVYEEVKLENVTVTIDLTQNIAYEQVKKTVS